MFKEVTRIIRELDTEGYTQVSYEDLGLLLDPKLVGELCTAAAAGTFSPSAADLTKDVETTNMIIAQDEVALELGRRLVRPVVETIFRESPQALSNWSIYGVNRYDAPAATLGCHQDSAGATVLVVSASGVRNFNIHERPEFKGQQTPIKQTIHVEPGTIMILDAQADPAHSATCVEGPSVSVVVDVPDVLRPPESYQINQL
jgi:hypothetical protein